MFRKWLYYSLTKEDYDNSTDKEFPQNYNNLWYIGLVFFLLSIFYACLTAFPIFLRLPLLPYTLSITASKWHFILSFALVLSVLIIAIIAKKRYKKYEIDKTVSKKHYLILVTALFFTTIAAAIHLNLWSLLHAYDHLILVFMVVFMNLVIVPPVMNLVLVILASFAFLTVSYFFRDTNIWHLDILNIIIILPITLTSNWYVSMNKIKASFFAIQLKKENESLKTQSTEDPLTGLKNRRDFEQRLQRYLFNYRENDNFLNLGMLDIDHFKQYNDNLGHPEGDKVLKKIAEILTVPWDNKSVYAARVGGEEFALLWFGRDESESERIVLKLQDRMRSIGIEHPASLVSNMITISLGVCVVQSGSSITGDILYKLADEILYEAKNSGRNKAIIKNGKLKTVFEGSK